MIKVENGECLIEGTVLELASEAAVVLNRIYKNAKRIGGRRGG